MVYRSFHTDDVIKLVKVRECLWNPRNAQYGDKFAKQHAWYEICMAVIPKFNKRPFEEQTLIAKAVQARWKTARDAFMKCINDNGKKFTYRGKSNYVHYDILTFLQKVKDYEEENKRNGVFGNYVPEEETQLDEEDTTTLSNDDDDTEDIDFNLDMNEDETNPEDSEVSTNVVDNTESTVVYCGPGPSNSDREYPLVQPQKKRAKINASPAPRGRKRKSDNNMSEFETKLLNILSAKFESKSYLLLAEDDQNFFNSLAPMIRKFNNSQKLHFRSRVLEILREVETVTSVRIKNEPISIEVHTNEDSDNPLGESVTFQYADFLPTSNKEEGS
ncbi:hypothetical protein B5X24_HaOG204046 [Helicoverpa armigera]|uniref:MADF domain-containing protein n=1 Tax=Helicoverpa armigera TaxID=29058 RepID=A0A2W1BT93_HELAM|nr:hypothetical protein B5X24_HaOG204046 [Helicoverpa armigera]